MESRILVSERKTALGVDPIRLNLFFDLLSTLSKIRDFDSLGSSLSIQLRFVIEFDECYFILGDPEKPRARMYTSTKESPRAVLTPHSSTPTELFKSALDAYSLGLGAQAGGKILCFPLTSKKGLLGVLILTRSFAFSHSEYRFAEAVSGFLAQMLDGFSMTDALTSAHVQTQDRESHQKLLVRELEAEKELREKFVSALSHDLRTPLTAAKLAAQILGLKPHSPEVYKTLSQRISVNIDRLDRMILDLLDANRLKAGQGIAVRFESCKVDKIISSIVKDLNLVYGDRFQFQNDSENLEGYSDCSGIQRILENLSTNAIKYGKPKTPILIHLSSSLDSMLISVHNEGNPISVEDQKTVFSQYSRTESAIGSGQKGWGIGLSLVKAIAKAHQGSVRVESTLELGTTFFVMLALKATPESLAVLNSQSPSPKR